MPEGCARRPAAPTTGNAESFPLERQRKRQVVTCMTHKPEKEKK